MAKKAEALGVKAFCIKAVRYVFHIQLAMTDTAQDCGVPEDNARLVKESVEKLGGLDVIIANAGWS